METMEKKENKARKKKITKETKLPTYLTSTGNNYKAKAKNKTTILNHKKINKTNIDKDKINKEINEKKIKTEVKPNVKNVEEKIEQKKEKEEYIPYSCIPNLESGKDLTISDKDVQK